jgi:uncharacterized RDD family membrane protein YckC
MLAATPDQRTAVCSAMTGPVRAPGVAAARPAPWPARLRASLWDYLSIVVWLAALTVLGLVLRALLPPVTAPTSPLAADAAAFLVTVLPVWILLTTTESGRDQATWGKRRAGLVVTRAAGDRPGRRRVAVRNAVKLLPWQLAHVAVARLITGADEPVTIWSTYALSLLVPVLSLAMAGRDPLHRALHDRVAGTRVVCS